MTELDALRLRAQDLSNEDPEAFLAALPEFQHDPELGHLWTATGAALAFERGRRDEAWFWLERALQHGFFQPELFPSFGALLAAHPHAEQVRARLAANTPRPPLELLDWPDPPPHVPLRLGQLPSGREEALRAKLPPLRATALETALDLLAWTHACWAHAGSNGGAQGQDALTILERAERGERFRCVEYGVLLAAALCARGIPARVLGLRMAKYHAGVGAGHVVAEAWIDDLCAWVPLDGQNGAYWCDAPGVPLSTDELRRRCQAGAPPPSFVTPQGERGGEPEVWWPYFAWTAAEGAGELVPDGLPFVPFFEGRCLSAPRLTHHEGALRPDLSDMTTRLAAREGEPAVVFKALHPYALGVEVEGRDAGEREHRLSGPSGEHFLTARVRTPFGLLPPRLLRYWVS